MANENVEQVEEKEVNGWRDSSSWTSPYTHRRQPHLRQHFIHSPKRRQNISPNILSDDIEEETYGNWLDSISQKKNQNINFIMEEEEEEEC